MSANDKLRKDYDERKAELMREFDPKTPADKERVEQIARGFALTGATKDEVDVLARWFNDTDHVKAILNKYVEHLGARIRDKKKARRRIVEACDLNGPIVDVLLERPKRGATKNAPKKQLKDLRYATYYEIARRSGKSDSEAIRNYIEIFEGKTPDESNVDRVEIAVDRALENLGKRPRKELREQFPRKRRHPQDK